MDEESILVHCKEHEEFLQEQEVKRQIELQKQEEERKKIINEKKQEELQKKQQLLNTTKKELINVIVEDDAENDESYNDQSQGAEEMNKYWDNQYKEFLKKQKEQDRIETQNCLNQISLGNLKVDEIQKINQNIQYVNNSLLTIGEDQNEKFDTSYFEELAKNQIVAPIMNIKKWFDFSNYTLQNQTIMDDINEESQNKKIDVMDAQHDLKLLQQTAERFLDDELIRKQSTNDYLEQVYKSVYINAMVQVIEQREKDQQKKSIEVENCYTELDEIINGPVDQRNKNMSIMVQHDELLEDDENEQQRILQEVNSRYDKLKQKQKKLQEQNVVIFQSKIKEIQEKYKNNDAQRVRALQQKVTQSILTEKQRMEERFNEIKKQEKMAQKETNQMKSQLELMKEEKARIIMLQQQQQEQLLLQQQQQDKLLQDNQKQEQLLLEQQKKEEELLKKLQEEKEKQQEIERQNQEKHIEMLRIKEALEQKEEQERQWKLQEEERMRIQEEEEERIRQQEEEEMNQESEEESSEEGFIQKTGRNCQTGFGYLFTTLQQIFASKPKTKNKNNRNRVEDEDDDEQSESHSTSLNKNKRKSKINQDSDDDISQFSNNNIKGKKTIIKSLNKNSDESFNSQNLPKNNNQNNQKKMSVVQQKQPIKQNQQNRKSVIQESEEESEEEVKPKNNNKKQSIIQKNKKR